ncbi:hypothetical protein D3C86_2126980 [compost metagenome]
MATSAFLALPEKARFPDPLMAASRLCAFTVALMFPEPLIAALNSFALTVFSTSILPEPDMAKEVNFLTVM